MAYPWADAENDAIAQLRTSLLVLLLISGVTLVGAVVAICIVR